MAKPNYQYEKRKKDLEKKRKREEKRKRKAERKAAQLAGSEPPPLETAEIVESAGEGDSAETPKDQAE